jgi:hypothetical protein
MPRGTRLVELDLQNGVVTNEPLMRIGSRLWKASNAVWEYRYPRVVSPGYVGPWMLRQPLTFPVKAATTYTSCKSFRDIGYTFNTGIVSSPTYTVVMGADTSDIYRCWPASGGAALSYSGAITFTVLATPKRPGCSVYWDTPGTNPRSAATGTIDLDYDAATKTITRASGSFVSDGFAVGDTILVTDSTSNDGTYTVSVVTALVLTVTQSLVNEVAGTSTVTLSPDITAGTGALIFSHREGTHVYYLLDNTTTIRSLTSDVTNCPAGANALAIHLDRLWLAKLPSVGGGAFSYVYYTDPLDLNSIRTTSVLRLPGNVLCLIPGQFGATDVSGVPHLIIGTDRGVHVLDGDPQLGGGLQANLRELTNGVGIPSPLAAAVTPYGVFFLGTDGDLWHIPPGCQSCQAVGGPIRNVLGVNNFNYTTDSLAGEPLGSVVWLDPYLYIFPGGETTIAYIAEVGASGLKFWGPVVMDGSIEERAAIVKAPMVGALYSPTVSEGAHPVHSIDVSPSASAARFLAFDEFVAPTGSYPNGGNVDRFSFVQSGLLTVPGHRVQAARVILETLRVPQANGSDVVWTVTVTDERGNSAAGRRTPESAPAVGTYSLEQMATQHFSVDPIAASRGVSVKVVSSTEANAAIVRLFVELHTSPAQF